MSISREDLLQMTVSGIVYVLVAAFLPRRFARFVFDPLGRWIAAPGYWWFAVVPTALLALFGAIALISLLMDEVAFKRREQA